MEFIPNVADGVPLRSACPPSLVALLRMLGPAGSYQGPAYHVESLLAEIATRPLPDLKADQEGVRVAHGTVEAVQCIAVFNTLSLSDLTMHRSL